MIIFLLILPFVYPKPYSTYEDILGNTLVHVYTVFIKGVSSIIIKRAPPKEKSR